jgi:hypothetical protein
MRIPLAALILMILSTSCYADEECSGVIALSRIHQNVIQKHSEVQQNAEHFCSEYSQYQQSSATHEFGASYKFLSASFSSGTASADEVASKYCSASDRYSANKNSYEEYVESIAPGAYSAYEQCMQFNAHAITFKIDSSTMLARQFAINVVYKEIGKASTTLRATPSSGVTCTWNDNAEPTISITSPAVVTLTCQRSEIDKKAFVNIAQATGDAVMNIPWPAYVDENVMVNAVDKLEQEVKSLQNEVGRLDKSSFIIGTGENSTGDGVNGDRTAYCPNGTTLVGGFCNCSDVQHTLPGHYEQSGWYCRCGEAQPQGRLVATAICRRS